ncbi:hypothetical protein WDW86_19315, partial [Bdellovibrionota bacterium FG-2]
MIYAFPTSIILVTGMREIFHFLKEKLGWQNRESLEAALVMILILLIAANPGDPWRGRLLFQLWRPPKALSLQMLDPMARWFYLWRPNDFRCEPLTDTVTGFYLETQFG